MAYLMIAQKQYEDKKYAGNYNVGPDDSDCWTTGELVTLFCNKWNAENGTSIDWTNQFDGGPHEAGFLKLDCSKLKKVFGWKPRWNVDYAMSKIIEWTMVYLKSGDVGECMDKQIEEYLA